MYVIAAKLIAAFYALCVVLPLQNKVTLLSRQGKNGSIDLRLLEGALKARMPEATIKVCATEPEIISKSAFVFSIPSMVYHVATSRVCVLEGYIPAVSIPNLRKGTTVVQMWHALGAIKKFGFQSVGAESGRSAEEARVLSMHRNYDWIIAGGPGAVEAYAEAFGYDASRVLPLGIPRIDYLLCNAEDSLRRQKVAELREVNSFLQDAALKVLYAPTLRRGESRRGWLSHEVKKLAAALQPCGCMLVVAGHPLDTHDEGEAAGSAPANVRYIPGAKSMDLAELCDCVVTDYSASAFEAALLNKPVFFYVPDIEDYRISTGLNIDPLAQFPSISSANQHELAEKLIGSIEAANLEIAPQENEFIRYSRRYFVGIEEGATVRLATFVTECYRGTFKVAKG